MHKMKKHSLYILFTLVSAAILVGILAAITVNPTFQSNGFNRKADAYKLEVLASGHRNDAIELIHTTPRNLYFKTTTPGKILVTDYQIKESHYLTYPLPENEIRGGFYYTFLSSTGVQVLSPNARSMVYSDSTTSPQTYSFPRQPFSRVVKIGNSSFIFRGFDSAVKNKDQIFYKGNPISGDVTLERNISEIRNDMGLGNDGYLTYDTSSRKIAFVHFYKNEFFVADTNLNILYRSYTIDTLKSSANKKLAFVETSKNDKLVTNGAPDRIVNGRSDVFEGKLYNQSKLKADNESNDLFGRNMVLDIYSLDDGKYQHSVYIPNHRYEKAISFKILKQKIVVVYPTNIVVYSLL
ncbi:hypothetical protein [Paraflavitalea sp. CAU 1676]|uniref:hypothetical protein n=1 Tax=Paraflavitalea sp. CAU 1676 TaxID=3032598 RepID=UPI0023DB55D8|nr:hypothetical protein [Paraflavitalea sp. CAU 1676]MDF2191228.1 hypothetical protein [Paraflavitalea sp. CAU 1676]